MVRRAEQAVLAGGAAQGAVERDVRPASKAPLWLRGAGWRRLAWPAVAIAAALLVMFFDSQETPAPREVAQAPRGPTSISARPEAPAAKVATEAAGQRSTTAPAQTATAPARPATAMSRDAASPGEVAGGEAAATGRVAAEMRKDGGSHPAIETIVYRVPPAFIRDNTLEKILAKSRIAWTADRPDTPALGYRSKKSDEPVVADSSAMKAAFPLERKIYTLRVTDEQRAAILAELDAKPDQVRKAKMLTPHAAAAVERPKEEAIPLNLKERSEADGAASSLANETKSVSVHPLTIVLEAPAAAPADDEAKP